MNASSSMEKSTEKYLQYTRRRKNLLLFTEFKDVIASISHTLEDPFNSIDVKWITSLNVHCDPPLTRCVTAV